LLNYLVGFRNARHTLIKATLSQPILCSQNAAEIRRLHPSNRSLTRLTEQDASYSFVENNVLWSFKGLRVSYTRIAFNPLRSPAGTVAVQKEKAPEEQISRGFQRGYVELGYSKISCFRFCSLDFFISIFTCNAICNDEFLVGDAEETKEGFEVTTEMIPIASNWRTSSRNAKDDLLTTK